jgi:UDP-N-acetylglucosamine 2-epimerase (non-hydrolysing)/GDP/UDP-N,N'-diacetylbacillosamine 2-epimerase (hydrolysing)
MVRNEIENFLFFFDSRATFSYSNNIIKIFKKNKKKFKILLSGNYLEKESKINLNIFKKNNIKINYKIKFGSPRKKLSSWPKIFGRAIINYAKILDKINPGIVILTGDRIETLALCITCSYMNIPIAHIQAGDKSGHIDDVARAAIAKFTHIHFAPSKEACIRLKKWGEESKRIFFTGAPQLNDIRPIKANNKSNANNKKFYIIIFHPVLNEQKKIKSQIHSLIEAINETNSKAIWIYPNTDIGFKIILSKIKNKNKNIKLESNIERSKFLELLNQSSGMIGNSSSGIIEASILKKPVINIGNRQNGRPQSTNIVNANYQKKNIIKQIKYISNNKKFIKNLKKCKNPYYKKNSSKIIFRVLNSLKKSSQILNKY